jgi:membrane protein YdbS with pleckstrin-like domain
MRRRPGTLAGMDQSPDAPAPAPIGPPALPTPERPERPERLERRTIAYWYVTDVLRPAVLGGVLVGGASWFAHKNPGVPAALPTAAAIAAGLLLAVALVAPPLAWQRWSFAVDDRLLRMRYGILFVEERLVPVPRMQHIDLVRNPIERLFGLSTLLVFTAGNEGSAFRVPGLAVGRATELRDRILRSRGNDTL